MIIKHLLAILFAFVIFPIYIITIGYYFGTIGLLAIIVNFIMVALIIYSIIDLAYLFGKGK